MGMMLTRRKKFGRLRFLFLFFTNLLSHPLLSLSHRPWISLSSLSSVLGTNSVTLYLSRKRSTTCQSENQWIQIWITRDCANMLMGARVDCTGYGTRRSRLMVIMAIWSGPSPSCTPHCFSHANMHLSVFVSAGRTTSSQLSYGPHCLSKPFPIHWVWKQASSPNGAKHLLNPTREPVGALK